MPRPHAAQAETLPAVVKAEGLIAPLGREFGRLCVNKEEIAFGREKVFAMTAIRKSRDLQEVVEQDPESLREAVLSVAFVGLSLNPLLGHAYLVAHSNKVQKNPDVWKKQAVLYLGYKGLVKLATAEGAVQALEGGVVFKGEPFDYEKGTESFLRHRPTATGGQRTQENALGAYCVATLRSGQKIPLFLPKEKILVAKKAAKTTAIWDGPSWDEMWIKTAFRALLKTLPRDGGVDHAIEALERVEPQIFDDEPRPPKREAAPKEEPRQTVVISEQDGFALHAKCVEAGLEGKKAEEWLQALAESLGAQRIADLPLDKLEAAKTKLAEGLAKRAAKKQAAEQAGAR